MKYIYIYIYNIYVYVYKYIHIHTDMLSEYSRRRFNYGISLNMAMAQAHSLGLQVKSSGYEGINFVIQSFSNGFPKWLEGTCTLFHEFFFFSELLVGSIWRFAGPSYCFGWGDFQVFFSSLSFSHFSRMLSQPSGQVPRFTWTCLTMVLLRQRQTRWDH